MSSHSVDVVRISEIKKHPNADSLGLVDVQGFTCAVRIGEFSPGDLIAYVPPDSIVPDTEQFSFLGSSRRIKVKKLRGVYSQGLIIAAPPGSKEGDDVMKKLGITHYNPPVKGEFQPRRECKRTFVQTLVFHIIGALARIGIRIPKRRQKGSPSGVWPIYDVENWRKNKHILQEGELVLITEKIHGANSRYLFHKGRMYVGSHNLWRGDKTDMWWHALEQNPWIEPWCKKNPGICVYAEIFGQVQDLKYDSKPGGYMVRVFDLFDGKSQKWLEGNSKEWAELGKHSVPMLACQPYHKDEVEAFAEGKSTIAGHLREGCVIRAIPERCVPHFGRVQLKIVGNGYLERCK
jgi:tRNA-binding EMAP/Myf-like protein